MNTSHRLVLCLCLSLVPALWVGCDSTPTDNEDIVADATSPADTQLDAGPSDVFADSENPEPDAGPAADVEADSQIGEDSIEPINMHLHVEALEDGQAGTGTEEDPYRKLEFALDAAPDGATIQIHPGTYSAWPVAYDDPGCGNCDDATYASGAKASRGFLIEDKSLHLIGDDRDTVILDTNAGYGVLFINAGESSIQNLTVTGGMRDADGQATDGGIVVKYTTLLIEGLAVVENDSLYEGPLEDPVVGVCGIVGREGSDLTIRDCVIEDNSWDGIAFYRSPPDDPDAAPKAIIEGCRIGCTSECVYKRGRGVGIGITWDAHVTAIGNVVHNYWKGIGSFGNSTAIIQNNLVRDQVGWGIIGSSESTMIAMNNVITRSGTTGLAAWNLGAKGSFINNIVYANGTSADEWVGIKTGIWFNADPNVFQMKHNLVFDNANFDVCSGGSPNNVACTPYPFEGENNNLLADPLFVSTTDFHLQPASPCIDAGDPTQTDPDGSVSDMGVYGGPFAPEQLP